MTYLLASRIVAAVKSPLKPTQASLSACGDHEQGKVSQNPISTYLLASRIVAAVKSPLKPTQASLSACRDHDSKIDLPAPK